MSTERIRASWSSRRCPFGVADKCITNDCNAWHERSWPAQTKTERVWKRDMDSTPSVFSDWSYEDASFTTIDTTENEYGMVMSSKKRKIRKYHWYKSITVTTVEAGASGGCSRLRD